MPAFPFLRLRRTRTRTSTNNSHSRYPIRPVYIYPGLLRMSARRAIALDNACPAALYDLSSENLSNKQYDNCAICLEPFLKQKDIIRRLPCTHVFHSKCILSWITSADRCPLCNEAVVSRQPPLKTPPNSTDISKTGPTEEAGGTSLPDVTPSTLCDLSGGMQAKQANIPRPQAKQEKRCYSFVLHDHARYAHLSSLH